MPLFTESVPQIVVSLADRHGDGRATAPPSEAETGTFEAVASAYLIAWGEARAVACALEALRDADLLDPATLAEADPVSVEECWASAGARGLVKLARPLQRIAAWASEAFEVVDGRLEPPATTTTEGLREGLRAIRGVGPATADAILLDGLGRAAYPVDRATYRILVRHGWIEAEAGYDEARSLVEAAFPDDPHGLARLSADFARLGRDLCKAGVPRCDRCPLAPLLPDGGPVEG